MAGVSAVGGTRRRPARCGEGSESGAIVCRVGLMSQGIDCNPMIWAYLASQDRPVDTLVRQRNTRSWPEPRRRSRHPRPEGHSAPAPPGARQPAARDAADGLPALRQPGAGDRERPHRDGARARRRHHEGRRRSAIDLSIVGIDLSLRGRSARRRRCASRRARRSAFPVAHVLLNTSHTHGGVALPDYMPDTPEQMRAEGALPALPDRGRSSRPRSRRTRGCSRPGSAAAGARARSASTGARPATAATCSARCPTTRSTRPSA